jgi:hypothetical protein
VWVHNPGDTLAGPRSEAIEKDHRRSLMPKMTQEKLDAIKRDISRVLDQHGVNNEMGVSLMLGLGAGLHLYLGGTPEGFISTAEFAMGLTAQKSVPQA